MMDWVKSQLHALGAMMRSLQWMRSLLPWYRCSEFKETSIVAHGTVEIKALGESECVKSFHVQWVQGGRARSLHMYELVTSKIMKSFFISKDIILDLWNRSDWYLIHLSDTVSASDIVAINIIVQTIVGCVDEVCTFHPTPWCWVQGAMVQSLHTVKSRLSEIVASRVVQ